MRVAVIGSRGLWVNNLGKYLPDGVTETVAQEHMSWNVRAS